MERISLCGSRFLQDAEQRYAAIEGETLAVAWALEQTKFFTMGCDDLIIVTDHQPLCKLLGDRTLDETVNSRLFRIKQRTLPWKFSISWMPGKKNLFADAASRHPLGDEVEVSSYAASLSIIMRTQGDNCEAALMAAIKSDLNKIRAVTWERVREATLAQFERLMRLVQHGFPENRSDLPVELDEFWEFCESLSLTM